MIERKDGFGVCNRSERVIVVCGDADSARHYAVLMSEAWHAGYRTGYRSARRRD